MVRWGWFWEGSHPREEASWVIFDHHEKLIQKILCYTKGGA